MHHPITAALAREHQIDIEASVRAAQRGDERAWERLIKEFTPTLKRIATGFGLQVSDVEDVVQITWVDAYRNLSRLTRPLAFAGWIATTVRRNAARRRRASARELLLGGLERGTVHDDRVLEALALEQRAQALSAAVQRLPTQQQMVLGALLATPCGTYREAAASLGVPVGTIGPTRARSFKRLRADEAFITAVAA